MKNNKLKYLFAGFVAICLLLIVGSVCTYFLYILPQQEQGRLELQKEELEYKKQKDDQEREEKLVAKQDKKLDEFKKICKADKDYYDKMFTDLLNSCEIGVDQCQKNYLKGMGGSIYGEYVADKVPSEYKSFLDMCIDYHVKGLTWYDAANNTT